MALVGLLLWRIKIRIICAHSYVHVVMFCLEL